MPIEGLIERIDGYRSAEAALAAQFGQWCRDDADPAARREFAAASARHAWHLSMWDARRPQLNTVAPPPLPTPWNGDTPLRAATTTDERRRASAAATEQLVRVYGDHAAHVDGLTDPATAEILRRILR